MSPLPTATSNAQMRRDLRMSHRHTTGDAVLPARDDLIMVPPWIVELQRINAERRREEAERAAMMTNARASDLPVWYFLSAPYVGRGLNPIYPDQGILADSIIPGIL